ncbi:MAG: hypothetical protein AMXMBFR84_17510 [Candidatus Hydrogenedentota bacterium]
MLGGVIGAQAAVSQPVDATQGPKARQGDLRLGTYITSRGVQAIAESKEKQDQALEIMDRMGLTRVYLEVYRSGHEVPAATMTQVRDLFQDHGVEVTGGIATTPGGDVGVPNEGPLTWYNWQNPKTQADLKAIVERAAPLFDTFIVDDFFCTGDVSAESAAAKGDRPWPDYRRELLSRLASDVFVAPAKAVNPGITMIIKYPQWYDLFHEYGYDVANQWKPFDQVWVGTETRGATTQRFGFTQPYEGFVNYRWIQSITGDKLKGAWFDHGDCLEHDFIDQCYMSILAGAREFVFFEFGSLQVGHPDHAKVKEQFTQLADLAAYVRDHPARGIPAYKPANSDAWPDVYLFDFLGMLGIPLVPVSVVPEGETAVLFASQAAADSNALNILNGILERGGFACVTPGFLTKSVGAADIAGVQIASSAALLKATAAKDSGASWVDLETAANVMGGVKPRSAQTLAVVKAGETVVPFFAKRAVGDGAVYTLNTFTYTPQDFLDVNEVLLSPKPQGILDLPREFINEIRNAFTEPLGFRLEARSRVTLHLLGSSAWVVQNFNEEEARVQLTWNDAATAPKLVVDRFTGERFEVDPLDGLRFRIPARGRVWLVAE